MNKNEPNINGMYKLGISLILEAHQQNKKRFPYSNNESVFRYIRRFGTLFLSSSISPNSDVMQWLYETLNNCVIFTRAHMIKEDANNKNKILNHISQLRGLRPDFIVIDEDFDVSFNELYYSGIFNPDITVIKIGGTI